MSADTNSCPTNGEQGASTPGESENAGEPNEKAATELRKRNHQLLKRGSIAMGALVVLGVVASLLLSSKGAPSASVSDYLAWVGVGGAIALLGSAFSDLMTSISKNDEWDVISHAAKLFAALWAGVISLVAALN